MTNQFTSLSHFFSNLKFCGLNPESYTYCVSTLPLNYTHRKHKLMTLCISPFISFLLCLLQSIHKLAFYSFCIYNFSFSCLPFPLKWVQNASQKWKISNLFTKFQTQMHHKWVIHQKGWGKLPNSCSASAQTELDSARTGAINQMLREINKMTIIYNEENA